MAINYGAYSQSRAQALAQLNDARKRQLEAEADARIQKAQADARKSTDMDNLLNLGIQAGAAYLTGGASLAFAPQMNQVLMGNKQGWSRGLTNLGAMGYGMAQNNMAQSLADADQQFARKQASDERMYQNSLAIGDYDGANKIAQSMNSAVSQYDKDRKKFKEEGFLQHLFSPQSLERSNVPSNIEMRPLPKSQPTKEQLTVESTQKNIPSQQPMAGPELSYSSPIQNMDNDMLTEYSKRLQRMYG